MPLPSEPAIEGARETEPAEAPAGRTPRHGKLLLPLGFTLAGCLIVVYAAWVNPVLAIPQTVQFGLLEVLPRTYWLGLGLVGFSVLLAAREEPNLGFVVTGSLLIGLFAATPALFEPNVSVWDTYFHFANAQAINVTGHLPVDPALYAANWPGLYLVVAIANALGGLPPLIFVSAFPLFSGVISFIALYVFFRSFFNPAIARPASVVSSVLNVWAQYHISPQGIGLALALLVLATAWERRTPFRVANVLLFLGLVVSHATSTVFLLTFFAMDLVLSLVVSARPERSGAPLRGRFSARYNPFLAYAAVFLGWLFFVAGGSAEVAKTAVITQISKILQVGESTANIVAARSVGNIYVWPPRLRLAALGLFGVVGVISLMILLRSREERGRARFLIAALVGLSGLGLADILFFGGFFYDRSLMFFSVFVPGLCLYALSKLRARPAVRRAVLVLLLVGAMAAASTAYYQEAFNFVPDQSVAMSDFLSSHADHVLVLDGLFPEPIWRQNEIPPWIDTGFFTIAPLNLSSYKGPAPTFAVFDPTARLWYVQGRGIEIYEEYEAQQANFSLVYDNGFAQAYLLYSPPASP
jgi:hypothetical protein